MTRKHRYLFTIMAFIFLSLFMISCSTTNEGEATNGDNTNDSSQTEKNVKKNQNKEENPVVTITMEDDSQIKVELYPDVAPNTVNNFITLIEDGFYDGLTFHRVIPDFMIQGGDPDGNGTGGPGYAIKGEFDSNGFGNDLKHTRGVISMARSNSPDSAGSQFFIMQSDAPNLDGDYAGFGEVTDGMDTVDEIVSVERDDRDMPEEEQVMKKVEVDTKGHEYDDPKTIEAN